jgi:hypothetical protein
METLVLTIAFIIVFGGIGYVVIDTLKHFSNKKAHH